MPDYHIISRHPEFPHNGIWSAARHGDTVGAEGFKDRGLRPLPPRCVNTGAEGDGGGAGPPRPNLG
jgi:hypothetical protein